MSLRFITKGLALLLVALSSSHAQTATYPSKPIHILVPFAAGSGADIYSRFFGKKLSEILNTPVIVENKLGGGGAVAIQAMKNEPADGYTIFMGSNSPAAANVATIKNLPYDPLKDLRPISGITRSMAVFMVGNTSPLKNMADLLKRGQQQPPLNIGYYTHGYQLAGAQLTVKAGLITQPVMYKGLSQTMTDVMGGQVDMGVVDSTGSVNTAVAGKVRALLVTGTSRHPDLPDVPTLVESGYPEAIHYSWTAFFVNPKTPDKIVEVLASAMQKALAQPESIAFIKQTSAEPMPLNPEQMRNFQEAEIKRFVKAAQSINFQAED
jgi:tripartite-type tricarboxylate transporter receptor subunit TctC